MYKLEQKLYCNGRWKDGAESVSPEREEKAMLSRRQFVTAGTVGLGTLAVGGVAGVAAWDGSTRPRDPAGAWAESSGVNRILLAATLAASSHNTQPWRFRATPDAIELLGDAKRTMGAADPRLREMHVSLGCALANMELAAAGEGMATRFEFVPGPRNGHHARLALLPSEKPARAPEPLAEAIPHRRTNRGPYAAKQAVPLELLGKLGEFVGEGLRVVWLTTPEQRAAFTRLTVDATAAHVADATMQRDSHRWYRMRRTDAEQRRDGITVGGANLAFPASLVLGLMPPTPDSFDEGWAKATEETHCGTAPAFGLIVAERGGDHRAWLETGRAYGRMQLSATIAGIATHPLSQALAVRDREVSAGTPDAFASGLEKLAGPGEVVLAFRLGYPEREQQPSLRRVPMSA